MHVSPSTAENAKHEISSIRNAAFTRSGRFAP